MSMCPCQDCNEPISSTATACPNCGAVVEATRQAWKTSDRIAVASACISSATLILAVVGALIASSQFGISDNWKRQEFLVAQLKDFDNDKINQNILAALDYNPAVVELYPYKANADERSKKVYFDDLVSSIENEKELEGDQLLLRQQFEHFLLAMSRFHYLTANGAVQPRELCADLGYPLSLLAGDPDVVTRKHMNSNIDDDKLAEAVGLYLSRWDNPCMNSFLRTMGSACRFQTPYLHDTRSSCPIDENTNPTTNK